ncbi:MAG: TerC family protein [Flavobacteriales bacterium]|jgi:predicted tellurium resistance membrane protein TerC|nr:TerC family protein [Flavobacteriales bacterium]
MDFSSLDPHVLLTTEGIIALLTLTALEIVLGIDNIIVISILSGELEGKANQRKAQRLGLGLAMITRLALLFSISFIMSLHEPAFHLGDHPVSGRDLVLIIGGLFLIWKATVEIHAKVEHKREKEGPHRKATSMMSVVLQIIVIDIVFSLDSVITAVGMSNQLLIMSLAVIFAVLMMLFASGPIADFVNKHGTVKVLALAFLVMIGAALIMEGFGEHVNKAFIYFAMGFSVLVEFLNLRMKVNEGRLMQKRDEDIHLE